MLHRRARCTARPGADAPARGGPAAPAAEGSAHRPPLCPGDRRNAPVTDRKDTRPGRPLVAWRHRAFRGGGDGAAVPKVQRGLDEDFKSGAVRLVFETGKPMAQVARELGVNEGTLGNWVAVARHQRVGGDGPLSEDEWVIRSWRPRSATWSGSICTRRPRRWCCAWMRNRSCRRWSAPPRCSPSGPARRSGPASTTSGTAPPRCSPHSRWPPAGSPTPAPNGTGTRSSAPFCARSPPPTPAGNCTWWSTTPPPTTIPRSAPGSPATRGYPRVHLHFTPTSGSWLNLVEAFFSIITRPALHRGNFPTVADLIAAIQRFIDAWNDQCRPFTWTKDPDTVIAKAIDPRHRKASTTSVTEHRSEVPYSGDRVLLPAAGPPTRGLTTGDRQPRETCAPSPCGWLRIRTDS